MILYLSLGFRHDSSRERKREIEIDKLDPIGIIGKTRVAVEVLVL